MASLETLLRRYGCVLDAGSSGTRIYIYRWLDHTVQREKATPEELDSLPLISTKKKWTKKIRPGISTFHDKISRVGPDHLEELFEHARTIIPPEQIPETPLFLLATAGVRLLPDWDRRNLLTEVCNYAIQNTNFLLPDCGLHVQAITGETEGLYGWIAANYLIGAFDANQKHNHGKGHHTYGFLDMGGASAQIAFVPNATETRKHADDLKLLRMRKLSGEPVEYKVFVTTWLGFGVHEARSRYLNQLKGTSGGKGIIELPDPCLHEGLLATMKGKEVIRGANAAEDIPPGTEDDPNLAGTGKFDECQRQVHPLLSDGKVNCDGTACLLDGHHFPKADFDINHFLGVSEYWHTTHEVFEMGHDTKAYDLATYSKRVRSFCSEPWESIKERLEGKEWGKKVDAEKAMTICFRASWIMSVLHDGIGIPRIGLDTSGSGHNATKDLIGGAKDKGFLDPFQAIDDIHDVEVSWTLGKMVLYATSIIPPRQSSHEANPVLPVGFGSNSLTGESIPPDFEFAGGEDPANKPSHTKPPTHSPPGDMGSSVSGVPIRPSETSAEIEDDSDHWHGALWNNTNSSRRIPGGILYERLGGEDAELGGPMDPSMFELTDFDDGDMGSGSNGEGGSRGNTIRRGVSTGNIKGLGIIQTNLQAVSGTEFLFSLPSAQTINHIVVFLLPTTQLPPEYAATVYFRWPGKQFQLLGGLSVDKQSAIFRLRGTGSNPTGAGTRTAAGTSSVDDMVDEPSTIYPGASPEETTAQLGISIEPIAQVQQKLMSLPAHLSSLTAQNIPSDALVHRGNGVVPGGGGQLQNSAAGVNATNTLTLARRIIKNAFNYLGSFSTGPPGAEMVPMKEFQSWWNKFERKLAVDSSFLEREDT
ncbi:Guanosine-diphosphatase [Dactylella cylindrospora]|nr:Guanosine-diphosphatase [Dactylella cylindrospora]